MKWVSTAAQVRELDRRVIEGLGLPGIALMELASRAVAEAVAAHHADAASRGVVALCGGGNNGGDGYGAARWLHAWGLDVATWSLSATSGGDAGVMRACARAAGVPEVDSADGAGLVIDAVFGTGLTRPVEGRAGAALASVAASGLPVVAVDLPSGLHADSGSILGMCVPALRTVTFGRHKLGMFGTQGATVCGTVAVADIGLDASMRADPAVGILADAELPEDSDLVGLWPRRALAAHKRRSGHLLVAAGSTAMAGAAVLCCRGALAADAGLITLLAPRGAMPRLGSLPPEVMVRPCGAGDVLEPPDVDPDRYDAIAAGPGLGGGRPLAHPLAAWLEQIWRTYPGPVVFDADALPVARGRGPGPRALTPHPGEAARMLGTTVGAVQADRFAAASALARDGAVALLKGRHTLVAQDGARLSINPTGTPVLATGGSGDVLTGIVGALLGRGLPARDALRCGCWAHGRASEVLEGRRAGGWTASDVAAAVPEAVYGV